MLTKPITYTTFDGEELTEKFYFNLTEAELAKMQLHIDGGFKAKIEAIVAARNIPELEKVFSEIVEASYGIKSDDGKRFMKIDDYGHKYVNDFKATDAYSRLYMELMTDAKAAAAFINGILPKEIREELAKQNTISANA